MNNGSTSLSTVVIYAYFNAGQKDNKMGYLDKSVTGNVPITFLSML